MERNRDGRLFGALLVFVWLLTVSSVFSQSSSRTKKRVIAYPDWSASEVNEDDGEDVVLDVVEIRVAGEKIAFDKPFEATDSWLQDMTLQIKNVSKRPIEMITLGGGLLGGLDEKLEPYASYQYGIGWLWDSRPDPAGPYKENFLEPGSTVTLSYGAVDPRTRKILAKKGQESFCRLSLLAPGVRYFKGETDRYPKVRFSLSGF